MRRLLSFLIIGLALGAVVPSLAAAEFSLGKADVYFENKDKSPALFGGSHPFAMKTEFAIGTEETADGRVPNGELRNLTVEQIPGMIGSQTAVPLCSLADFDNRIESRPSCSDASAVGYAGVEVEFEVIEPDEAGPRFHVPVYSLEHPPGVAARLGFVVLNVPVTIDVEVEHAAPYRLIAHLGNVPQAILLYSSEVVLWGNPADPAHDALRGNCLGRVAETDFKPVSLGSCPVDIPQRAFLTMPRTCGEPLATLFTATSWSAETATAAPLTRTKTEPAGIQACEELAFSPAVSAVPDPPAAETAAAVDFNLQVDQTGLVDPAGRAPDDIRRAEVTLPEGMTLNPAAANGLVACSQARYEAEALDAPPGAGCPEGSRVGSVAVQTPLLDHQVTGDLYVAEQNQNPFGSLFALYMVIKSERDGIIVKQAGKVEPDPQTGRLRSTFEEIPQLPFAELTLHFRGGPGAPLTTPPSCGEHQLQATFAPWSGNPPVSSSSAVAISSGAGGGACPVGAPPFHPGVSGGTSDNTANRFSPFYMRLARNDGEQELTGFDAALPPGVLGKIAGVERCSQEALEQARTHSGHAELEASSCPAGSRIGSIRAGAGVGESLTWVEGTLYLAGPYRGAPLSVVAVTPAVAGPFDLGTVVVREGLALNPVTGQVEVQGAASDPLPRILQGVPLHLRELRIHIDRPGFTLNATSCEPEVLGARFFGAGVDLLGSADDASASASARYQARGCGDLGYRPRLSLKLKGGTKRGSHPALRAVLTQRPGEANNARAVVALPHSEFLAQDHIRTVCTRVQFAAEACPKASVYGFAKAKSPLLDGVLEGPVYLRSSDNPLPDLVAALEGPDSAAVRIDLVGRIDSFRGGIRTTFAQVPDAPVTEFVLAMQGGKRGLLENSRGLCASKSRATARFTGQNGRVRTLRPVLRARCGKRG